MMPPVPPAVAVVVLVRPVVAVVPVRPVVAVAIVLVGPVVAIAVAGVATPAVAIGHLLDLTGTSRVVGEGGEAANRRCCLRRRGREAERQRAEGCRKNSPCFHSHLLWLLRPCFPG